MSLHETRRRDFLKSAIGAATLAANPLGLLSTRAFGAGSIPTGEYLQQLSGDQFWFTKLNINTSNGKQNGPIDTEDAQLSIRLGIAGGFAIGYFSTISFLSDYKVQKPDDYRDLLIDAARLPETPIRPKIVLSQLNTHRQVADLKMQAQTSRPVTFSKNDLDARDIKIAEAAETGAASRLSFPLDSLGPDDVLRCIRNVNEGTKKGQRESNLSAFGHADHDSVNAFVKKLLGNDFGGDIKGFSQKPTEHPFYYDLKDKTIHYSMTPEEWGGANQSVQKVLNSEFGEINNNLESRITAIDSNRLIQYEDGKLNFNWVNLDLLQGAFRDGIDKGRVAALAYIATAEASSLLNGVKTNQVQTSDINPALRSYRQADMLMKCFSSDDFQRNGLDAAAFRPAVRLMAACTLVDKDQNHQVLELITPFLPFDINKSINTNELKAQEGQQSIIVNAIRDRFSKTYVSRWELPATTLCLADGAFAACPEMFRHTSRLIRSTAAIDDRLKGASLSSLTLIPEVTSPWTFSGVAAGLCNTLLIGLSQDQLKTEQDRRKFRDKVDITIEDLLIRSAGEANGDDLSGWTSSSPALIQYTSGYRASRLFADHVADQASEADGARKVYASLAQAMPEYFQSLPQDKFLTADQIADTVFTISKGVKLEIDTLRLKVLELTSLLQNYKKFVDDLGNLVSQLQGNLSGVNNVDDLRRFQQQGSLLIDQMSRTADEAQRTALKGMQGLINTYVQVGLNIETTVTASVTASVKSSIKANVNFCSIGGNK
jgi:hypothetical protein